MDFSTRNAFRYKLVAYGRLNECQTCGLTCACLLGAISGVSLIVFWGKPLAIAIGIIICCIGACINVCSVCMIVTSHYLEDQLVNSYEAAIMKPDENV